MGNFVNDVFKTPFHFSCDENAEAKRAYCSILIVIAVIDRNTSFLKFTFFLLKRGKKDSPFSIDEGETEASVHPERENSWCFLKNITSFQLF